MINSAAVAWQRLLPLPGSSSHLINSQSREYSLIQHASHATQLLQSASIRQQRAVRNPIRCWLFCFAVKQLRVCSCACCLLQAPPINQASNQASTKELKVKNIGRLLARSSRPSKYIIRPACLRPSACALLPIYLC